MNYSTVTLCSINKGLRGYGCSDGSLLKSLNTQLMNTLCLSLSNLFFIPAIIIACKRCFLMEAVAYITNMFFSTVLYLLSITCYVFFYGTLPAVYNMLHIFSCNIITSLSAVIYVTYFMVLIQ